MTDDAVTLLCTGDIHIGRRPSRLPSYVESRPHAAKAAWMGIVDEAIDRDVDALVLTGDVVDRENRYYEALGPLEAGLRRLAQAGIETFAVAGNHDVDVFPEIADSLDPEAFHLLGPRGTWTREPLVLDGEEDPRVFLDGWSFPQAHVDRSPLETYEHEPADVPVLGVLHGEVDAGPQARYSPVRESELARAGPDLWLLGHIHQPVLARTETGVPYLYPGSPQPLDPGEQGPHGPRLVEVSPSGEIEVEELTTATVRYEELAVDLTDAEEAEQVRSRMHERIRAALRGGLGDLGAVEQLVCRLTLEGPTPVHGALSEITAGAAEDLELTLDGTTATVDKVTNHTRPAIDLDELAEASSPPGELARIVQAIDEDRETDELREVLHAAEAKVREVDRSNTYAPVFDHDEELEPVERVDLRELVRQQALGLIDELERQKRGETA